MKVNKTQKRQCRKLIRVAIVPVVTMSLSANADINWDGDNPIGNFSYANNWYGDTLPTWGFTSGNLVFNYRNNGSQTSLYYDLAWNSINDVIWETTFGAGLMLSSSGSGINFNQRIENRSSFTQIINMPISGAKNGATQIEFNPVNGDLTLSGAIFNDNNKPYAVYGNNNKTLTVGTALIGSSAVSFNLNQNSKVILNGANTFAGGVKLNAGTLVMGNSAALGDAAGTLTLAGGTLDLAGFSGTITGVTGSPGTVGSASGGNLTIKMGNRATTGKFTGSINLIFDAGTGTYQVLDAANDYTGTTEIKASALLAITNASGLGGTGASSGTTIRNGGILEFKAGAAIAYASETISADGGAKLRTNSNFLHTLQGPITVNSGALTLEVNSGVGQSMKIDGAIGGTGGITKSAAGTLTLTNAGNNYSGATTLSGGTTVLSGGNNRLPAGTALTFATAAATLDVGGNSQTVGSIVPASGLTGTVTNGSLSVGGSSDLNVNGANGTVLDFSGLSYFNYSSSTKAIRVQPTQTANTQINELKLSRTGVGSNTLTATAITVGGATGTSANLGHEGRIRLGIQNVFNTDALSVGGFNASGLIDFQSGVTNGSLKLVGSNGSSRMATATIGFTSSGTRVGSGVLNLSNGTLDAFVSDMSIGRHGAQGGVDDVSSVTMPGGTLDVLNLVISYKSAGVDSVGVTGTLNQTGGTAKIQNLTLGRNDVSGGTPKLKPAYNLNNATLYAQSITAGAGGYSTVSGDTVRNLNISGGTVRNYNTGTDLSVTGLDPTSGGLLNVALSGSGVTFVADPGRTITIGSNARITGASSATLTKDGAGVLTLSEVNTYSGNTQIQNGTLALSGSGSIANSPVISVASTGKFDVSAFTGFSLASGQKLKGTGRVYGNLKIASGSAIAPGNSPGTINTDPLSFESGSTYEFEINDATPGGEGVGWDLINVTGAVTIGGSASSSNPVTIKVFGLSGSSPGTIANRQAGWQYVWTIAKGTTAVFGFDASKFAFDLTNWSNNNYTGTWSIRVNPNDNTQLQLVYVPEPNTFGLIPIGVGMIRRRQRVRSA